MTATGGGTIAARGGVLNYVEAGRGPDLVWLPGGNDFAELVLHAQRGLLDSYHLIAIDPRGQGRSHAPADPDLYAGEHHVDDLLDALDALGLRRPLLGGHSRGSRTVLEFAARHPARARAVVAVCVPALGGTRGRAARYRGNAALLREQGLEAFLRSSRTAPRNPERRAAWEERLRRAGVAALAAQYEALARRPFLTEAMSAFESPVLIVTGEHDHLRPDCEALADAVAGLQLVVIANAAHAPMTENPEAYYAAVCPFLGRWASGEA
ncbi:MAG TPA: alpha/beta hydrolase [Dehalococcoidia bacterium]|nr:alpha/beta hydrolase [Dehalococcoidia bacterium]